jgi:predicted TIM-barrel fold metal-dependent hydrolase
MPIVDIHVHCAYTNPIPESFAQYIVDNTKRDLAEFMAEFGDPRRYVALMDENGIDYSCVLAEIAPITSGLATNEYVAEFCAASPRLLPICSVNPFIHHQPARLLERLVRGQGFRGLKLYPTYAQFYPNDTKLYPVYAKAEELGIPVQVHTGSSVFRGSRLKYGDPLFLDDVAVDFPDLTILVTHGGRPFWYDHAFALCRFHPNVYIDVAGLPPHKLLTYFPDLPRLPGKFVFGSDWPGVPGTLGNNVAAIRALPIPDDARDAILGGTAARLYRIEAPSARC